jgi:hypothetical protein
MTVATGRIIFTSYFGTEGKLVPREDGFARVLYKLDNSGGESRRFASAWTIGPLPTVW